MRAVVSELLTNVREVELGLGVVRAAERANIAFKTLFEKSRSANKIFRLTGCKVLH